MCRKIYHIVHVDRLGSIMGDGCLWSDSMLQQAERPGTTIGMSDIKQQRLLNPVKCHNGLMVGQCVPFYFCPRSVMLFVIHKANHPALDYRGGQEPIVHLEADLQEAVTWSENSGRRWAFTLSNAGSRYFEDRCDMTQLHEIDWNAVRARSWSGCQEEKQAEFLVEKSFPWNLIRKVGAHNFHVRNKVLEAMQSVSHRPVVDVQRSWYY